MPLHAGSAVAEITPHTPNFLEGYHARDHAHESVHDPLKVRTLYLRGDGGDALLVSADILWFHDSLVDKLYERLGEDLGLGADSIFLCATHTHSAPYSGSEHANPEWVVRLAAEVVAAASTAKDRLQTAKLRVGRGECRIGMNRRQQLPDGSITLGCNPDGEIDRELIVLSLDGETGQAIARVCNFACHGVVLGPGNYAISADWMGVAAHEIESELGAPMLFINGGSGNIDPIVRVQTDFEPVERLGRAFVEAFKKVDLGEASPDATVGGLRLPLQLPRKQRDFEDGRGRTRAVSLSGLRIGPVRLVGFKGEIFTETSLAVKSAHEGVPVMVCSYVNGHSGGYVPTADAWELGGYEVRISLYAREGESLVRQGFTDLASGL